MAVKYIVCPDCEDRHQLGADEAIRGLHLRKHYIPHTVKPQEHNVVVEGRDPRDPNHMVVKEIFAVPNVVCDTCYATIGTGPSYAITYWRGDEPDLWEIEFGYGRNVETEQTQQ